MTTTHIDVLLHMRATVEVDEAQVLPVRMRIQAALDELVATLDSFGVEYGESDFYARERGKETSK
jgi:hypothetical protein